MGEQFLHGLRVPFDELLARLLEPFEHLIELINRSHLETTSTVWTPCPFPKDTLRTSYAIH